MKKFLLLLYAAGIVFSANADKIVRADEDPINNYLRMNFLEVGTYVTLTEPTDGASLFAGGAALELIPEERNGQSLSYLIAMYELYYGEKGWLSNVDFLIPGYMIVERAHVFVGKLEDGATYYYDGRYFLIGCPTIRLIFPDGSSFKHMKTYGAQPELFIKPLPGFDLTACDQFTEAQYEQINAASVNRKVQNLASNEALSARSNGPLQGLNVLSYDEPVTENQVILLGLEENYEMPVVSGINAIDRAQKEVDVTVAGHSIVIKGASADEIVRVLNFQGQTIYAGRSKQIELPAAGIYIVVVGTQSHKVVIK